MLKNPASAGPLRAATLAAVLLACTATAALAAEATVEMQRIRNTAQGGGPGPVIGKIVLAETAEGVTLQISLAELPPGPNRLFLHEPGDCNAQKGELLTDPLATVNIDTTEGGAEPLRKTLLAPGATLAGMTGKALVFYRGSQLADAGPEIPSQPRLVACGVIR